MRTLVFFLEEESARRMLQKIVPRLVPQNVAVRYIVFEGKQDLEQELVRKLRAWRLPDTRFIILRDQDSGDCRLVKQGVLDRIEQSGRRSDCLVRIACHELESFYLGDLAAVAEALGMPALHQQQQKALYRTPDAIANAAQQLKQVTGGKYTKVAGSSAIAPYLKLDGSNRSVSFQALCSAIEHLCS